MDLKKQIFEELAALEEQIAHLQGMVTMAGKQTNLEVAILTEQLKTSRKKNAKACALVNESIKILKNEKK